MLLTHRQQKSSKSISPGLWTTILHIKIPAYLTVGVNTIGTTIVLNISLFYLVQCTKDLALVAGTRNILYWVKCVK